MSSDAGDSDLPKRSHKALPLSEKVQDLNLIRKKNRMLRLLKWIFCLWNCEEDKNSVKLWRRKNFAVAPQTAKITAIVCVKYFMKMEES